jgi:hypothetical protein
MCLFHLLKHDWLENAKLAIWENMGRIIEANGGETGGYNWWIQPISWVL